MTEQKQKNKQNYTIGYSGINVHEVGIVAGSFIAYGGSLTLLAN